MGCRKFKGRQYYDDLTGQTHLPEELEEFVFVFEGEALELDLDEDNAQAFRDAMAPFVKAARRTSKSRVLATLPKRKRHLQSVPSPDPEIEPQAEAQNSPETQKGQSAEALPEPEGTRVPEQAPNASDSRTLRPDLRSVPRPTIPDDWAPYAPTRGEDQPARVRKVRGWATTMGRPSHETLTQEVFTRWEDFYRNQGWARL